MRNLGVSFLHGEEKEAKQAQDLFNKSARSKGSSPCVGHTASISSI